MRSAIQRLVLLALGAGAVISCDTRLPTASRRAAPGTPPSVVVDSPVVNTQVNLGDSIFVLVRLTAGNSLKTLTVSADALTGDKDLGTFLETPRYATVKVDFPKGTRDTTIRRYLKVLDPANQKLDSLVILAIATDSLGLVDTSRVRATIVSGPHVVIESPAPNDSIPPGVGVSISAHATDADGIGRIQVHVTGDPTWPTPLDTTVVAVYDGSSRDVTLNAIVSIPLNATPRSRLIVNASSTDAARQPGAAAPIALFIRSAASIAAPRVTQVVPTRSELNDTVVVTATGQGIVSVGLLVRDSVGNLVSRDSILLPAPITSNVHIGLPLKLTLAQQGRHLAVTAFAVDQTGKTGYAVRATIAGSETVLGNALVDSTQIVYGQTFTLPLAGTVSDVTVDVGRGNVFLSNTDHNRLDVWQSATKKFDSNGIAVGSLPWGLFVSATNPDTLLVANSGGTNISRVFIGSASVPALHEDLANRILTRNVYVHELIESRDNNTGKGTVILSPIISYSDRPQNLAQSTTGRIYFSTRPTSFAPSGTIRYVETDTAYPAPDPRIIHDYVEGLGGTEFRYVIFNIDSVTVNTAGPNSPASDDIVMWDHPYGKKTGVICVNARTSSGALDPRCRASTVDGTVAGALNSSVIACIRTMAAQGSDVESVLRLDLTKLPLSDTVFVSSSFDHHWVAFGEGNSAPGVTGARVVMALDSIKAPAATRPQFISPLVTVRDLTENASERVFGLALDKTGKTVAAHGLESYFTEVDDPFHLRLQGKYNSFDNGAGVALHPDADGRNTPMASRLAFVASASGQIEIVDIAYFINRGQLQLKYPIYGPLRASKRMPGDDPSIVLKLFALTQRGLIVIDLTAADIKAGPP